MMKTIIKLTTMGFLALFLSVGNISGQEQPAPRAGGNGRGLAAILSAQQKEMLKQRAEKRQEFRKAFKASISQKQKDILEDPRVMPVDRQKAFRASLTDQQVVLIKSQKEAMKKMREDFRATLTPEQKAALKRMNMPGRIRNGPRPGNRITPKPLVLN